jgi:SP family general alpha glucoside:H+ symporter-like MFS transporter
MINPNAANWQGKTAFFWAGTCLLFFVWAWFRLPESKDRSYEQLDILFNEHVGARQFAKMQVNAYAPRGERVKVA